MQALTTSIRARLTLTFTTLLTLFLLSAVAALLTYALNSASHRADHTLHQGIRKVEEALTGDTDEVLEDNPNLKGATPPVIAAAALRESHPDPAEDAVVIITGPGGKVWRSRQHDLPPYPSVPHGDWITLSSTVNLRAANGQPETYTILVGVPWARVRAQLLGQAALLLTLSLCVILMVAFGTWMLVGRTLLPIDKLAQQAQQSAAAEARLDRLRLSAPSQDAEVVRLVGTLNHLLDRIGETNEQKGRFYAAASHELRTPLHVLAGQAELALSRPRSNDEYRGMLQEIQAQAERLSTLVRSLLLLNRLDRGIAANQEKLDVDVAAVCVRTHHEMETAICERRLRFTADLPDPSDGLVIIAAYEGHLEILVRNLLENATRYTSAGGRIQLTLTNDDRTPRLDIFNESAPLNVANAQMLLEPFFRPDASRNSKTGGNGLGLSLCKALADANGWNLTLHSGDDGFRAIVTFCEAAA